MLEENLNQETTQEEITQPIVEEQTTVEQPVVDQDEVVVETDPPYKPKLIKSKDGIGYKIDESYYETQGNVTLEKSKFNEWKTGDQSIPGYKLNSEGVYIEDKKITVPEYEVQTRLTNKEMSMKTLKP